MELIRRIGVGWWIALGAVVLAFVATVLILNSTVYSASGFVRTYLDALARQDAEGALELAATGPASAAASTNQVLLSREAMGTLSDIEIVEDDVDAAGTHHVVAEYVAGGVAGSTEFEVRRDGSLFGLFNAWSFAAGPFAALEVTVQHERVFTANGIDLIAEQDVATPYLVFVPSTIELSYDSELYTADPVGVLVSEPGVPVPAAVDLEATDAFVAKVQAAVDALLDACTTQRVLQPGGCPFGETIVNRVVTEPAWTIVDYPDATLVPDGRVATWRMPITAGTAHLVVDIQSIFDGTITTYDRDVPFSVEYEVVVLPDGEPSVRPYVP